MPHFVAVVFQKRQGLCIFKPPSIQRPHEMTSVTTSWQEVAEAKRLAILDAIPEKWRIRERIPPATELPDITGNYIQGFLSPHGIEITEADAVTITKQTASGNWSAVEVTEAFCHRAAIAHQLVCKLDIMM